MSKKQKIIIAVMAVIGLLLAAWILAPKQAGESHDDHGHDGKEKAPAKAAAAPPVGELAHAHADAPEKIVLDAAQVKAAGIALAAAAPAKISVVTSLPGEIRFNEDRTAHVVPKLAGVVMEVHADLGQSVKQGQVLAVIASSGLSDQRSELLSAQRRLALASTTLEREKWQDKISAEQDYLQAQQAMSEAEIAVQNARQKLSAIGAGVGSGSGPGSGSGKNLNRLELRAPFSGVVMEKHLAQGEAVKEDAIVFTLSDLSTVWAEIAVPQRDLNLMRVGETVTVKATAFAAEAKGKIIYVGELLGEQTRTAKARVALANPDRAWRPGLFITVDVLSGSANRNANAADAAVAVASDAVQMVEEKPVVFVETAGGFLAQPVKLGRSDGKMTEVLAGLKPGVRYVATGSFVLKAELGKDSAEHTH